MAAKKRTKKSTGASANKSEGSHALEFARAYLKKKPAAPFSDVKAAASKKNLTIYPITYGRAKALEGLVKMAPRGSKKNAGVVKRGPGRPKGSKNKRGPGRPRNTAMTGLDSIDNLVGTIKTLQRERDDALRAIEKIRSLLASL